MQGAARPALSVACVSRTGRRPANEDTALAEVLEGPSIAAFAIVADGMGGHNAGEVASAMTAELLSSRIRAAASGLPAEVLEERLLSWVAEANRSVFARSETQVELKGMGTTIAVAVVARDGRLAVANVGDSKVFLVRGVVVTQLSVDHTALAERRRALGDDEVSREEEISSPFAHALTRSLGQEPRVLPDSRGDVTLEEGDVVLVTSDGVTDVLESDRFLRAIESSSTAGSRDNISVALLSYGPVARLGAAPPAESARPPETPSAPPRRSARAVTALAGAVALAAVAAFGIFGRGRRVVPPAAPAPEPPRTGAPAAEAAPTPEPAPEAPVAAPTPPRPTPRPRPTRRPAPAPSVPQPASHDVRVSPAPPAASTPEPPRDGTPLASAALESASLRRGEGTWLLELAFHERLRPSEEISARASGLRLVSRPDTPLPASDSYALTCASKERALDCSLPGGEGAFVLDPPLALGDVVFVRLEGEGFSFEAEARVVE